MKTTLLSLSALLLLAATLHAQTTATWTAGTGNWSQGSNWNTGTAPINGLPLAGDTYNAVINAGGVYYVQLDLPATVTGLTLAGGGGGYLDTVSSTLTVAGSMSWTSGFISGSGAIAISSGATMTMSGASDKVMTGASEVVNNGTASLTTGNLVWVGPGYPDTPVLFDNNGTFNVSGTAGWTGGGTGNSPIFQNDGVLNKSGASLSDASTMSAWQLNNTGTVNVTGGRLVIGAGTGVSTGDYAVSAGAQLDFAATLTVGNGTQITGSGTTALTSGTLLAGTTAGDAISAEAINLSGGNLGGAGQFTVSQQLNWNNSTSLMRGSGTTVIASGAVMAVGGAGDKLLLDTRAVVNGGTVNLTQGNLSFYAPGYTGPTISFDNNGAFNVTGASNLGMFNFGTKPTLVNDGSFNKGGTSTTTNVTWKLDNNGTVNVTGGTLNLNDTVTQHSGTTLTGGTWNVSNGSTLAINTGSDITTIGSAASVTLDGAGSTFNRLTDALNNNQGSFTLKNDRDLTTAGAYANSSTTRVEDNTTVMTIGAGGSAAYTQSGPSSVTILAGGAMIDTSAFNLNGGTLTGTGTIEGPLTATTANATTIAPGASPGTLTVNGSTVLGANNTLAMEVGGLAAGIDYDLLDVNGILTLGGQLKLNFVNGFQNSVAFGDIFTIGTADSDIQSAFSNVLSGARLNTQDGFGSFAVYYGAGSPHGGSNLVIGEFLGVPEPTRAMLLLGSLACLVLRRRRST